MQEKNIKVIVMETEGIIQWKGFTPLMNYKPDFCFFGTKIMVINMIKPRL